VTHDELVEKYPKILGVQGYPGVGKGWLPLIDALCEWLQFNTDKNSHIEHYAHQVKAVQIKEKFGGLSFYVDGASDVQYAAISFAESMSHHICEDCGAPGKTRGDGWIRTVCDEHAE
jgi:hypothetical protein